jgi:hypothetical protein
VGAAYTKAVVIVGVNALLTSGRERGIIDASWNVHEAKKYKRPFIKKLFTLNSIIFITMANHGQ